MREMIKPHFVLSGVLQIRKRVAEDISSWKCFSSLNVPSKLRSSPMYPHWNAYGRQVKRNLPISGFPLCPEMFLFDSSFLWPGRMGQVWGINYSRRLSSAGLTWSNAILRIQGVVIFDDHVAWFPKIWRTPWERAVLFGCGDPIPPVSTSLRRERKGGNREWEWGMKALSGASEPKLNKRVWVRAIGRPKLDCDIEARTPMMT